MKFKILIAEDEKDFRDILVSIVEMIFEKYFPSMELKISVASNGEEELNIVQTESQDIIITDINMPVMDGKEAVRKIRLFDKSVPILALTALTDSVDVEEIIQSGVSNYTSKPLNKKLFIAQIKAFVNFYLKSQFQYNKSAVNLMSKEVFKRKTIFSIERVEDLFEFWEYILELNEMFENTIEDILQDIYNLEEKIIRSGVSNEIILEENLENYYFTIIPIHEEILDDFLVRSKIDSEIIIKEKQGVTFLVSKLKVEEVSEVENSVDIDRKENSVDILRKEIEEARALDLRYSVHEKVSSSDLAKELDPSIEDKIENFDEDLELLKIRIYDFEEASEEDAHSTILLIVDSFNKFNIIIDNIALFNVITRTFHNFTNFLENLDDTVLFDLQKRLLLSMLLKGLVDDLEHWIFNVFIERNTPDIHYFDASFAENCLEIESTFLEEESDDSEEDDDDDSLEFF